MPKPEEGDARLMTRSFHSVSQVCRMLDLKPHVLRYWENEFEIHVQRNSSGRRVYTTTQIEKLRLVKQLIRREKLTVKGAKRQLARMRTPTQQSLDLNDRRQTLLWLKKELLAIRSLLPDTPPEGKTI